MVISKELFCVCACNNVHCGHAWTWYAPITCFTIQIYHQKWRLGFTTCGILLSISSAFFSNQALPTLVRMCKKDRTLEENVEGAETLSYLIEMDPELQKIASISDHIIKALAEYLKYTDIQQLDSSQTQKKVFMVFVE